MKKWKCTVCNYVHTGPEPPDKCPVCGADKSLFQEIIEEEITEQEETAPGAVEEVQVIEKPSFFSRLIINHHLHPISVHTPNGVIPVAVLFLALGVFFDIVSLEQASFFNFGVVLLSMPFVLLTGVVVWKIKYGGVKTLVFRIKLLCGFTVALLLMVLVAWRVIDSHIAFAKNTAGWIYLGIAGVIILATGIAGHLGGKLVFKND